MMKMTNNAALAAVRHLIQAENAVASSERITSHEKLSVKIAFAIHQFSTIQPPPSREELNRNSNKPGTQVISESIISSTDILPTMYSKRVNGRDRYSGRALLARSREINTGPMITVKTNASEV